MPTVTTADGVRIAYEEFGDQAAPAVVFIRGTGAAGNRWMPQVDRYRSDYRCVVFDNRGTGASSTPAPPYTVNQMADDTVALLDALTLEGVHLSGSSLGGAVALRVAARHPERVRTLQLHSSWLATEGYAGYSLNLLRSILLAGGVDFYYEATIPLLFSPTFLATRFGEVATILDGMRLNASSHDGLMGQIEANLTHDGTSDARDVSLPTLITVGECDLLLPVGESRKLHEAITHSALHIFPGCGHLASVEAAADFNAVTLDWLARYR